MVVMTATAAFAVVAAGGWPGLGPLARLLAAMFGGQLAVGAVNELVDADLDAAAKPDKPIPSGLVSRRGAWTVTLFGLIVMLIFSMTFGIASLVLCAAGTAVGIAYSFWFKRSIWSWIPYLIALPLLPIWVWISLSRVDPGLFAIYPIGAAAVIAVQIAQSLPDLDADRSSGVRTLAVALGPRRAHIACWLTMSAAAVLAASLAPWLTRHSGRVMIGAAAAVLLILANALVWRRRVRTGALACFPLMGLAAAALGVGWAASLVS